MLVWFGGKNQDSHPEVVPAGSGMTPTNAQSGERTVEHVESCAVVERNNSAAHVVAATKCALKFHCHFGDEKGRYFGAATPARGLVGGEHYPGPQGVTGGCQPGYLKRRIFQPGLVFWA